MIVFARVDKEIQDFIGQYLGLVDECVEQFRVDFLRHLGSGPSVEPAARGRTHILESKADDARRHIEMLLYGQALLPEYRGDIVGLLETYDKIPGAVERVLSILETEKVVVPEKFRKGFVELVACNLEAYTLVRRSSKALFDGMTGLLQLLKDVDLMECKSDRLEKGLVSRIFESDLQKADKIHLRDVVVGIGRISDCAEGVADRLSIIALKHRL